MWRLRIGCNLDVIEGGLPHLELLVAFEGLEECVRT